MKKKEPRLRNKAKVCFVNFSFPVSVFMVFLFLSSSIYGQDIKTISGKVTDSDGLPLPGATVVEEGTSNGTITNVDGVYVLKVKENATVVFSFVGMRNQKVVIAKQSTVNIQLEAATIGLDEVVAVGYGTMKKSDLTGSVVSVNSDEIIKTPMPRVDQALQGKIAGVNISNNKAQPGSDATILIRGANSINGNNSPLIVVDGVLGVELNMISPNDIETIDILKDASATAIYGSRGSNGVIIITTKKGHAGKVRFDFNSYYSLSKITRKIEVMNAAEQVKAIGMLEDNGTDAYNNAQELAAIYDGSTDTDWQDEVLRTAPTQSYALNISGGNANMKYSLSGSIYGQDGVVKATGYDRQTLRVSLEQEVEKKLKFGTNIYIGRSVQDNSRTDCAEGSWGGSVTQSALSFSPIISVYNEDGTYSSPYPTSETINNPVALINERTDQYKKFSARINLFGEYEVLNGLTFRSGYTYSYRNVKNNFWAGMDLLEAAEVGEGSITNTTYNYWLSENTLTFDKKINDHHLNVLGGFTASEEKATQIYAYATGFATETLMFNALELGETSEVASASDKSSIASFLGRINYSYKDRYLFTVNFRADGSSKFATNNKWGYFPSASIGWRINEENFMKSMDKLSNLKLRVSYGSIGSQAIDAYQSLASYANKNVVLGDNTYVGVVSQRIANDDLKWETTEQFDIGLDLGLFNNRINFIADYYIKDTKDLLYEKDVPYYTGYSTQLQNIGKVRNKGFEFALNTVNINKEFKWNTSFNISFNKNKVISLGGDEANYYDAALGVKNEFETSIILKVGEPMGSFYGYVFDGIYQNEAECEALPYPSVDDCEPGMVKLKDLTGEGEIDTDDRTIIGCAQPDFVFGFGNDFSWKGFDLNLMFQGSVGGDIMNLNRVSLEGFTGTRNRLKKVLTESWQGEGSSNTIQKIGKSSGPCSSRWIEDGSYVRLKNVSLGYTLPPKIINRWGISNFRVYISGQNLFTITDYSWYDPEINSRGAEDDANVMLGVDWGGYPSTKSCTIGINIGF